MQGNFTVQYATLGVAKTYLDFSALEISKAVERTKEILNSMNIQIESISRPLNMINLRLEDAGESYKKETARVKDSVDEKIVELKALEESNEVFEANIKEAQNIAEKDFANITRQGKRRSAAALLD